MQLHARNCLILQPLGVNRNFHRLAALAIGVGDIEPEAGGCLREIKSPHISYGPVRIERRIRIACVYAWRISRQLKGERFPPDEEGIGGDGTFAWSYSVIIQFIGPHIVVMGLA